VGILDSLAATFTRQPQQSGEQRFSPSMWPSDFFGFGGGISYQSTPVTTMYGKQPAEHIDSDFVGLVRGALQTSGPVSAVEMVRMLVFSEARFQWQRITNGRPGDLFGTPDLELLERPWVGGTTGDLLARMILDADFAGNSFTANIDGELVRLRPDWVDMLLERRETSVGRAGYRIVGYAFYDDGARKKPATVFLPEEVAHFAPYPDPSPRTGGCRG
jgi:hypothetical protein